MEEASLNAWPALTQILFDGWIVRSARGFTRRANSVTPLAAWGHRSLADRVRWCENYYARNGLATLFRLPSCCAVDAVETLLLDRGYTVEEPSRVLVTPIEAGDTSAAVRFTDRAHWLGAYGRLTGQPEDARMLHEVVLRSIPGDSIFAEVREDDRTVACGLAVVEDDLVGLFDIVTAPDARRRGFGRQLLAALHTRAHRSGARIAYLQMRADNAPAAALYAGLGYEEHYRYHYLRAP